MGDDEASGSAAMPQSIEQIEQAVLRGLSKLNVSGEFGSFKNDVSGFYHASERERP